eukprot:352264-Chlamydomonas_euryale.AAC.2
MKVIASGKPVLRVKSKECLWRADGWMDGWMGEKRTHRFILWAGLVEEDQHDCVHVQAGDGWVKTRSTRLMGG